MIGNRCFADACDSLGNARQLELEGVTYTAERKIGYDKLGDPIAVAVGSDVATVEIRSVLGVDPDIAIAVTGDGHNAVRYRQIARIGRVGPAIVRLNPDDPLGDRAGAGLGGILEFDGSCLYLVGSGETPEMRTIAVWPSGTVWHDPPRSELELRNGTLIAVGDRVVGGGGASNLDRLTGQHGDELLDGCTLFSDEYQSFHFLPTVEP